MNARNDVKMLFVIGAVVHVISYFLIYEGASFNACLIGGYIMAALSNPLLILIFGKYIAVHKTERSYVMLMCVGTLGVLLCGALWCIVVNYANAQWDNVVHNFFTLLSGACITCIFEANNNAGTEIEDALKNVYVTKQKRK